MTISKLRVKSEAVFKHFSLVTAGAKPGQLYHSASLGNLLLVCCRYASSEMLPLKSVWALWNLTLLSRKSLWAGSIPPSTAAWERGRGQ